MLYLLMVQYHMILMHFYLHNQLSCQTQIQCRCRMLITVIYIVPEAYYLPDRESKTDVRNTDQGVVIQHQHS